MPLARVVRFRLIPAQGAIGSGRVLLVSGLASHPGSLSSPAWCWAGGGVRLSPVWAS